MLNIARDVVSIFVPSLICIVVRVILSDRMYRSIRCKVFDRSNRSIEGVNTKVKNKAMNKATDFLRFSSELVSRIVSVS